MSQSLRLIARARLESRQLKIGHLAILVAAMLLFAACTPVIEPAEEQLPKYSVAPTPARLAAISFSASGKIIFVKNNSLWTWQNGNAKQLTSGTAYEGPSWSPDGKKIAAVKRADNYSDLVALNDTGKLEKQLTRFGPTPRPQDSSWARSPAWSPNGAKIAFSADPGTYRMALWTANSDGAGGLAKVNYAALGEGDVDSPAWSEDGKNMAFVAFWDVSSQIYVTNLSTGATKKLTNHQQGAYDPAWSPNGSRIAYVVRSDGKNNVWVMNGDGSNAISVSSIGMARTPRWSPDGQYVAFVASQGQEFDLFAVNLSFNGNVISVASDPKQLTKGQAIDANGGISWAR